MSSNSMVSYWVNIAEYDLETAEAMLSTKRYLYVGFMCHQTIEKMLKAYFVSLEKKTPPFIHSLSRLALQTKIYDDLSYEHKDLLDVLEPLNIETRYPTTKRNILRSLDHTRCEEIINKTKELYLWIKEQL